MKIFLKVEDIESTNIVSLSYLNSELDNSLIVKFVTGSEYVYYNVPFGKVYKILNSESIGSSFHKEVISCDFKYKKI